MKTAAPVCPVSRRLAMLILLCVVGAGRWAAVADGGAVTLEQAVSRALAANPKLEAVRLEQEAMKEVFRQAGALRYPHIGVEAAAERGNEPGFVFARMLQQGYVDTRYLLRPDLLASPPSMNNFRAKAGAQWLLYDGGAVKAARGKARAGIRAACAEERAEADALAAGVTESYMALIRLRGQIGVLDKAAEALNALKRKSADLLEEGVVVKSDAMQVDVRLAEVVRDRIALENGLEIARCQLARLMGDAASRPEPGAGPVRFLPLPVDSLEAMLARARQDNPNLERLSQAEEAAEKEKDLARSAFRPKAVAGAAYEGNSDGDGHGARGYTAALGLKWEVFDGFAREAKLAEAKIRIRQAEARRRDGEAAVALAVRKAWLDLDTAVRQVGVAETAVAQAQESYRIVADRYANGLTTVDDMLGAEAALRKAESDRLNALTDYAVRYVALGQSAGDALAAVQTVARQFLP